MTRRIGWPPVDDTGVAAAPAVSHVLKRQRVAIDTGIFTERAARVIARPLAE